MPKRVLMNTYIYSQSANLRRLLVLRHVDVHVDAAGHGTASADAARTHHDERIADSRAPLWRLRTQRPPQRRVGARPMYEPYRLFSFSSTFLCKRYLFPPCILPSFSLIPHEIFQINSNNPSRNIFLKPAVALIEFKLILYNVTFYSLTIIIIKNNNNKKI